MVDNININNININEQHDVFYEEYHDDFYGSSPEFRWNANYRQLRRASELMYVLIKCKLKANRLHPRHYLHEPQDS